MRIIKAEDSKAEEAIKELLLADGIFIYPTDTVYGIGGNALSDKVGDKIYKIKNRELKKPFSVIMGNLEMIKKYCTVDAKQLNALLNFLPGPYTFIMKLKKKIPVIEGDTVGVRVPEHQLIRRISVAMGVPIISTSSNISGQKDATSIEGIDKKILDKVDLIVDGGQTKYKKNSTVVDLINWKILREGAGEFKISDENPAGEAHSKI